MSLQKLVEFALNKTNFTDLENFIDFARRYLEFASSPESLQAVIVSRNEQHYRFFQYKAEGNYNITRPINSNLLIGSAESHRLSGDFLKAMDSACDIELEDRESRLLICNSIYTIQQTIGATLDALPAGKSNTARKINGDLFERLLALLIQRLGVDCTSGNISVPIIVDDVEQFRMGYQHDLIIRDSEVVKIIGGVKTSSKDRIDKIFMDKFLYCKLTGTSVPHIAIFLNDVQRKQTSRPDQFGVGATFLPGHFKAYTIKLNPLDGVYYCDIRRNMQTDPLLSQYIRTIDHFFCTDLWRLLEQTQGDPNAKVVET